MAITIVRVADIVVGKRFRKDLGDLTSLEASIREVGLLQPIVVTPESNLVAGRRRLEAWKRANLGDTIPAHVVNNLDEALLLLKAERDENVCRKDFTPLEAVALGERLEKLERPKADKRKEEGQKSGGRGRKKNSPQNLGKVSRHENETSRRVGESIGMSGPTYEKAKAVAKSGDAEAIDLMESTGKVERAWRELKRKEQHQKLEELAKRPVVATQAIYDVIVIDPPWRMEKIERDVRPNQAAFDYPTMTQAELILLKPPFANDCHVWLWTTQRFIRDAFELLDAWHLKYVCTFVWHKPGGFQPIGLPQFNCEFALYARRGTPSFKSTKDLPTCFNAPRGKHSEKPEEFYGIVRRVTSGRRLDMFSRRSIDGFEAWGKEAVA